MDVEIVKETLSSVSFDLLHLTQEPRNEIDIEVGRIVTKTNGTGPICGMALAGARRILVFTHRTTKNMSKELQP
jgi:hypothetical protein